MASKPLAGPLTLRSPILRATPSTPSQPIRDI
jgi:hypothetical protein